MAKHISLKEWIDELGVEEVAKLLGVIGATVRHWRRGHCLPRSEQMQQIKKLSRGAVDYDEMIDSFHKRQAKSRQANRNV